MLTKENIRWAQANDLLILQGRRCDPGDFYLVKRIIISIDPITKLPVWGVENVYCEPFIQILKGDERIVVQAGILKAGDIIATILTADHIRDPVTTDEPTAVGDLQYYEAVYKSVTYKIMKCQGDSLGSIDSRYHLYLSRESD